MKTITPEQANTFVAEGERKSGEARAKDVQMRLRDLVLYAKEHSPYFQQAYRDIDESFVLSDLPVTSKSKLMESYEDWVTDSEISLAGLMEYLSDVKNVSVLYLGRYTALLTSGTSGNPMPMVRDSYHNAIHGCLVAQRLLKGIDPNLMNPAHTKIASVITLESLSSSYSSAMRIKQKAGEFSENLALFSVLTPMPQLVKQLNAFQPKFLSGYASSLSLLAKEKEAGTLTIEPQALASSAELLSDEVYATLRQTFNCPVLNNYCSTEGGEIAMTCSEGHLHLNEDWIIVEPVDSQCRPVGSGNWSDGVLITDLTNYVQPVIRYHVNDSVRISASTCKCGSSLPVLEISGRAGEILSFNGIPLTFPVFAGIMLDKKGLLNWQLVQTGDSALEVRAVLTDNCNQVETGNDIVKSLKDILLAQGCGDVDVTLSNQDFLRSARGGKIPFTIKQFESSLR